MSEQGEYFVVEGFVSFDEVGERVGVVGQGGLQQMQIFQGISLQLLYRHGGEVIGERGVDQVGCGFRGLEFDLVNKQLTVKDGADTLLVGIYTQVKFR